MKSSQVKFFAKILTLGLVFFCCTQIYADSFRIRLVRASKVGNTIDPELTDVMNVLQRNMAEYSSFKLERVESLEVKVDNQVNMRVCELKISEIKDKHATIILSAQQQPIIQTTLRRKKAPPVLLAGIPSENQDEAYALVIDPE